LGDIHGIFAPYQLTTRNGIAARMNEGPHIEPQQQSCESSSVGRYTSRQTGQAAAAVRLEFLGTDSEIVTTNYDTLLEDAVAFALEERLAIDPDLFETDVVSSISDETVMEDQIVVRHLHGILHQNG
jgi:hypothetical protein